MRCRRNWRWTEHKSAQTLVFRRLLWFAPPFSKHLLVSHFVTWAITINQPMAAYGCDWSKMAWSNPLEVFGLTSPGESLVNHHGKHLGLAWVRSFMGLDQNHSSTVDYMTIWLEIPCLGMHNDEHPFTIPAIFYQLLMFILCIFIVMYVCNIQ